MRKLLAALAFFAALIPASGLGQQFPLTLPANTLYGRLGIGTGPGQAIPLSVLAAQPSFVSRGLGVGTSPIAGGTSGSLLFNNAGTLGEKTLGYINVMDPPYSAVCDDLTDDTTKIQTAASAAASLRIPLYLPNMCVVNATITVSNIPRVFCRAGSGAGVVAGGLRTSSTTADILSKNNANRIIIDNCSFKVTAALVRAAPGAGIRLAGNAADIITKNEISDQFDGIAVDSTISAIISQNIIADSRRAEIRIRNTVNADSGDGLVDSNLLATGLTGTVGIDYLSSGGWRILGNVIKSHDYGFLLEQEGTASTSILLLSNNSIESQTIAGIGFTNSVAARFDNVNVVGNYINSPRCITVLGSKDWGSQWAFSDNICTYTVFGINVDANAFVNINGNKLWSATVNLPGIQTSASWPSSGSIGQNYYFNTNTRYTLSGNTAVSTVAAGAAKTTAPALTSCGTSPGITGDDRSGFVQMGTGTPTGCVITFSVAYPAIPRCIVNWRATPLASQSYTYTTTAITLTQTATSGNFVDYRCDPAT